MFMRSSSAFGDAFRAVSLLMRLRLIQIGQAHVKGLAAVFFIGFDGIHESFLIFAVHNQFFHHGCIEHDFQGRHPAVVSLVLPLSNFWLRIQRILKPKAGADLVVLAFGE